MVELETHAMVQGRIELLEHILGNVSVGVATIDGVSLRIDYINCYLHTLLSAPWNTCEVLGEHVSTLLPAELHPLVLPLLRHVAQSGERVQHDEIPYEGFLQTRGRTYWRVVIERLPDSLSTRQTNLVPTANASGPTLLVTLEDVTETVRSRLHVNAIHSISSAIAGPSSLHLVLDRILQVLYEMVGSRRCAIFLLDPTPDAEKSPLPNAVRRTASIAAQKGIHPDSQSWHPQVDQHVLLGRVIQEGHTLILPDTRLAPELVFPLLDDKGATCPPGSVLCVPIFDPRPETAPRPLPDSSAHTLDPILGTIEVYHRRPRGFPIEEVQLLERFAQQAGLAIQNARLFRDIDRLAQAASHHAQQEAAARERIEAEVVARTLELQQRNEALQRSQEARELISKRMELLQHAREDFFTTMAHELKTPLANIRAHLSALLARDLHWSIEEQYDFLQTADEQVERLVGMINQFLDASRVEAGALRLGLEPILLPELFEDLQDRLQALIQTSQRTLQLQIEPELPTVRGDYELIIRVLTNLLSNAFRYAPEGDTVQLTAAALFEPSTSPSPSPEVVRISVTDRGPGITSEQQAALFTRFSTFAALSRPSRNRPGQPQRPHRERSTRWSSATGLGLYISRGIMEAHGSSLTVSSSPGQGASFSFTLPVFKDAQEPRRTGQSKKMTEGRLQKDGEPRGDRRTSLKERGAYDQQ